MLSGTSGVAPTGPDQIEHAASAIDGFIRRTPVIEVHGRELGFDLTLVCKLEFLQHSGSFKARGAAHYLATQSIGPEGIVAASGGNHGAAVAWAAQRFGHPCHVFVPTIAAPAKVQRLREYGAQVHQVGEVYDDALRASRAFAAERDAQQIHAYDDPTIIAGAGTCSRELDSQAKALDAVLLACGGGGLSGGAAAWFGDRVPVVVCETEGTPTFAAAAAAGEPVDVEVAGLGADALGATRLGDAPWAALSAAGASSALVTDDELLSARAWLWDHLRVVVEPAAAAPIAALRSGRWQCPPGSRVAAVLCGANTDPSGVHGAGTPSRAFGATP